jgi:hypothetical protein
MSLHSNSLCTAGLAAFELPLAYVHNDNFKQPVFGCNNLAGWPPYSRLAE